MPQHKLLLCVFLTAAFLSALIDLLLPVPPHRGIIPTVCLFISSLTASPWVKDCTKMTESRASLKENHSLLSVFTPALTKSTHLPWLAWISSGWDCVCHPPKHPAEALSRGHLSVLGQSCRNPIVCLFSHNPITFVWIFLLKDLWKAGSIKYLFTTISFRFVYVFLRMQEE